MQVMLEKEQSNKHRSLMMIFMGFVFFYFSIFFSPQLVYYLSDGFKECLESF